MVSAKSCAPTDRAQGVPRRGHVQFATLKIARRFVPDSMLAFSALCNTENGPPFVVWRDSVPHGTSDFEAVRGYFVPMYPENEPKDTNKGKTPVWRLVPQEHWG
jgi:hypothetical protein